MFDRGPQMATSCIEDYEAQAKRSKKEAKEFSKALEVLGKLPYFDCNHSHFAEIVGALFMAQRNAEQRFDEAVKMLEKSK